MYNDFQTLQSKCRVYYVKKTLKTGLYILVLFSAIVAAYYIYYIMIQNKKAAAQEQKVAVQKIVAPETQELKEKDKKLEAQKQQEPKVQAAAVEKITKKELQKEKAITKKDVAYDLKLYTYELPKKVKESPRKEIAQVTQRDKEKQSMQRSNRNVKQENEEKNFFITTKEMSSLESMLRAFENNRKYSLALKIAEHYYERKDFVNSLAWSKQANKLNLKDDQAWILYAKSEYAQGNKQKAIDSLKIYLRGANSKEAFLLLNYLEKGD